MNNILNMFRIFYTITDLTDPVFTENKTRSSPQKGLANLILVKK